MKKFIDITDFSREGLRESLNLISFIKDNRQTYSRELDGKMVVNITTGDNALSDMALKTAVSRMGGSVFNYRLGEGETIRDAVKTVCAFGDAIVIDHPLKGAARAASLYSLVPVINAGDGGRAYPVRTLCDFANVWLVKKHISNMNIGFLGDFSRNPLARGLLQCLNLYKGNEFYFVSVTGKPVSDDFVNIMDRREKPFTVFDNLFDVLPELDMLYMTKVDKTMFDSEIMYEARKHNFVLDERLMLTAKKDFALFHALPRGEELDPEVDSDPRACYFSSLETLTYTYSAILLKLMTKRAGRFIEPEFEEQTHDKCCKNPDCITNSEKYLPSLFHETSDGRLICKYCGTELKD